MAPTGTDSRPRIIRLADQLADDIAARSLSSGDPYLNTADAARLLGVNTASANRAMQLLVQRGILTRRQGRGAFVADPIGDHRPEIACVQLLVRKDYLRTEGLLADGVVVGLQGELPDAQLQFNFLPEDSPGEFVTSLVARAAQSADPQAFVLVRSSLAAQQALEESGLPAVVYGSLYPSNHRLPSIDRDNRQGGRLLAEYVLGGESLPKVDAVPSRRKLAVLLRERSFAGDHAFLDGVFEGAAAAELAPNEIIVRHLPSGRRAALDLVKSLPLEGEMGVICRSQPLGEAAVEAISLVRESMSHAIRIAVSDVYQHNERTAALAHLEREVTPEEIGRRLGRLLLSRLAGEEPVRDLIPVRLIPPVDGNNHNFSASPLTSLRRSKKETQ